MEFTRPEPRTRGSFEPVVTRITDRLSIWQRRHVDRRRILLVMVVVVGTFTATRAVSNAEATIDRLGTTRSLVVARQDLAAGSIISADNVELVTWPVGQVPTGSPETTGEVVGKTLRSPVGAGEPVGWHRLGSGRFGLTGHERSITLPAPLAPPPVEVGDQVELVGLGVIGSDAIGSDAIGSDAIGSDAIGTDSIIATTKLGSARILVVSEDGITVAVNQTQVDAILVQAAVGVVEIIGSPLG